eukprot:3300005-Prymnesium_polylepis.1
MACSWMFLWGHTRGGNRGVLVAVGALLLVLALVPSAALVTQRTMSKEKIRRRVMQQLQKDPLVREHQQDAFDAFDRDGSGSLDLRELRSLLRALYPRLTSGWRAQLFQRALDRNQGAALAGLKFPAFAAQLEDWAALIGHAGGANNKANRRRCSLVGVLQPSVCSTVPSECTRISQEVGELLPARCRALPSTAAARLQKLSASPKLGRLAVTITGSSGPRATKKVEATDSFKRAAAQLELNAQLTRQ